jgi:hypothetical protein
MMATDASVLKASVLEPVQWMLCRSKYEEQREPGPHPRGNGGH